MESILKGAASVGLAYTTHYAAIKLYNYACVPDGLVGFLKGAVSMGSPVCTVGINIISSTQTYYSSIILMALSRIAIDSILPGQSKDA